ncbi:hypothetical protein EPJ66_11660 [Brachyspira aalborgi]|uniref:hypothetical protein n=1 Tax=Brachyspira aalborgi TaxID=29522 RepID=UPI0011C9298B|nr:hypothetical protein [Brachyspira aalborgi]TXJ49590.1 hypothetical protein EPJ66_11660 [Brachyspira aalborgi]
MTEQEKQQLREDIKAGKVNIDELYEKYQVPFPYIMDYEIYKKTYEEEDGEITFEDYEKQINETIIEVLLMNL